MGNAAVTVDLNARIAQFETEMKRAVSSLDAFGKKGDAVSNTFKSFAKGLAGSLTVGAVVAYSNSIIDFADNLNDMSLRLGVGVKDLASFKLAAEQSGTSLDGVGAGIGELNKSIGLAVGGNKKIAAALEELGVTARDPKEAFFQLADAVERIEDPQRRAALMSKVLKGSYEELLPLLSQGGDALRESARQSETFAEAMARLAPDADKFNDNLADLKENAAAAAAVGLVPLVEQMNELFNRFSAIQRLRNSGASLFEIITGGVSADYKDTLASVNADIAALEAKQKRLGTVRLSEGDREELARLKAIRAEAAALAAESIMAPPKSAATGAPNAPRGGSADYSKARSGGSKAKDPFAPISGLLSGTDAGKLKDFDEKVGLLNRKFAGGAKDTEQYTQAMTALIETTFANNFKQAADDAEFFRMVEEDGIETTNEWNARLRELANVDMGRLNDMLANTDFARLKKDQDDMILLAKAFSEGIKDADGNLRKLSEAEYLDAVKNRLGLVGEQINELDTFAKNAAEGMQDAFADFLFDPFNDGIDGMLKGFGTMIQRMIAEAVAADLARNLFGSLVEGGSGDGLVGSALTAVGDMLGFDGGGYTGDGPRSGGLDGKGGFLAVMHPRETVVDHTRGQSVGSGHTVIVNVYGSNNAPDVRRAAGQGAREALGMLEGARRYG